jgi:methylated-DNA-[protein]-cysteine S-methyltransferase
VGANPFAPEVPCHRVVRSDGGLGGYSGKGGIKTKLTLLKQEGFDTGVFER